MNTPTLAVSANKSLPVFRSNLAIKEGLTLGTKIADAHRIPRLLGQLVSDVWSEYSAYETAESIVHPSIPILYFGDLDAYLSSDLRVLTAALNPSKLEFPANEPFKRFLSADVPHPEMEPSQYLGALGDYFQNEPYWRWFSSLEPILCGMGASFCHGRSRIALHTDLCSPLATCPAWSGLPEFTKIQLKGTGNRIWHNLVEFLQPDVILVSVASRHLDTIRFTQVKPPTLLFCVPQKRRPYVVTQALIRLVSGKETRLVFGPAAHTPFGLISNERKRELGRILLKEVQGV